MRNGKVKNNKLLPNSFRIISSCIKTVSTNASTAVRSAGASVAASISSSADDCKEQVDIPSRVLWAGFDKLELGLATFRRVLLLGYLKGFQVFDVEDASGLKELVSRRDGPVSFLQMLPAPATCDGDDNYKLSHPILVVVGGEEDKRLTGQGHVRYVSTDSSLESSFDPPTTVRFYSMKSNEYVKVIDFKSAVLMVRCSPRVVAVGLEEQIYCFDSLTLEKKFIVITYPVTRVGEQGAFGINTGYGPMAVGSRWLAYSPNHPFLLNMGRVSPKSLASNVHPSTYPGSGSLMARYAVESSKHLAAGIYNLGDKGYKKLSKYYPELLPDGASTTDSENAGVVAVKDLVCSEVISQFRAHASPISALCFDPTGTLLVTASVHGNNINIFRIMPSHTCNGSSSSDWSTSYMHLYKLCRGVTTAVSICPLVIQDICFSHYRQWIAIISSRGTCHIFVLSPFWGQDNFRALNNQGQGAYLFLASTPPWRSTNEKKSFPPPPYTLSVASRIKCSDSGLLNSVSNAAATMVGKIWAPSGAVAAIFHNSNSKGTLNVISSVSSSLEHILVYTPSGFLVQHEIQSSVGLESSESKTESWSTRPVNQQIEELTLRIEPRQWWDVSRRFDNLEREECIPGKKNNPEIDYDSRVVVPENTNSERSHLYLSNAEVQINSCSLPIWQKSKVNIPT
ncbi:hypothetical protein RD792_009391 [Penstemon davidsonii]|uniref:BCAS3 domain-containing protein n=1 Tax=Penstemon davidsonii TaxID=160366 RepID=A0ABR0CYW3_9LAMI|nr:hypothetical protein RD792_009391 [Penstemon davidsonii]